MKKYFLKSKFMAWCLGSSIIFLYPVLHFPKGELELLINQLHSPGLDSFFKYITLLGDGSLLAVLLVIVLFYNYYTSILVAFSTLIQVIIILIVKHLIFKGLERPLAFFDESVTLHFVDGVEVYSFNTFPSGHSASGFAFFALLFIIINNRGYIVSGLLFLMAFLVAFSRIYLLQHFLIDVYFGSILGILSVVLGLYFMKILFSDKKLQYFKTSSIRTTLRK